MKFRGSFVPLITPFDRRGRLDKRTLEKLVEWHIEEGTDGIICSATTGEGPSLSDFEKKSILEICVKTSSNRIPIIASTGVSDTKSSVKLTQMAQKLGADGALVVTPYYNKPTQKGGILHFSEVAKVGIPLILYHNPTRAAVTLTASTIMELAQVPNIVAIKESSHDLELIRKIKDVIDVFSGDDDIAFDVMKEGGVGTIATTSNLIPKGWKTMISLCLQKKWGEAEKFARKYLPFSSAIFLETNPQGTKYALSWLGRCSSHLRLPMILPAQETQREIKRALLQLALPQFIQNRPVILKS